jgi:aspartyl-tRNA(Asn)/glutamyl-tRNA(Gln) amidotransferase subunit B
VDIQLDNGDTKSIRIHHAHLEEDAGKSLHEGNFRSGVSGIDLNRAGTPLIEIVSEPDMRTAEEAVAFAKKLHSIVTSLGICDGEMSQGSMRFDVNISIRPQGETKLGTRTETKNLNSFKFMEDAIHLEVERQIDTLEDGGEIVQETRLYNGETKVARSMRSKEEANDYRYFPCPDLLPVVISDEHVEQLRANLPELPDARQQRFIAEYELSQYDASVLSADAATASYFEQAAKQSGNPKLTANWVAGELSARLNAETISLEQSPVTAEQLAGLVIRVADNTISGKMAKQVFEGIWNGEGDADQIIEKRGLKQVSDSGALEAMVDEVLASNQAMVDDYINTDADKRKKKLGGFMGQIMKASKGQANPQQVSQILAQKLAKML